MYAWALIYACLRPVTFFTFLKEVFKENRHSGALLRHKARVLHINAMAKEGRALFSREDVILDEGLFQALLSIYEREITARDIARFSRILKRRKVYMVHASLSRREERMRARGRAPREFMGEAYQDDWFPTLERNFSIIASWIKENSPHEEIYND